MLEDIKKMEGINNEDFDIIIQSFIVSAKKDLAMSGIAESKIKDDDKLIYSAIVSYVKSQIDVDNKELYANAYYMQKDHLRHYSDYLSDSVNEGD